MMSEQDNGGYAKATKPGRLHTGVGVGAIVMDRQHLLMVRRDGAHGAGTWSVPGGWVEMWEDPLDAAVREVKEETGITVRSMGASGWTDSQHQAEGVHAVTLWVRCWPTGNLEPVITEPDKCPEVAWVPFHEVARRPLFHPLDQWWAEHQHQHWLDAQPADNARGAR